MPYFTPDDVDVDVDDFMYQCNNREIKEVIEYLIEEGHIEPKQIVGSNASLSLIEYEFNEIIEKIQENRIRLTKEEDALLKKIADRF
jgi:Glu-tRNA(Gln) amidotransferase subunit E-like FAD-binding protein